MKRQRIVRMVEVCKSCGAWNSFRKGRVGKSTYCKSTGLRRIYGECRNCGAPMMVFFVPPLGERDLKQ